MILSLGWTLRGGRLSHLICDGQDNFVIHFTAENWAIGFHDNAIFAAILDDGLLLAERLKLNG